MGTVTRCGLVVIAMLVLSGCAFGNRHAYHSVLATPALSGTAQVGIATHDQRPYVLSRNKDPQFVGLSRGGYGNPFDVRTADDAPLADGITQALTNSLRARGFRPVAVIVAASMSPSQVQERLAQAGGDRAVLLTLREWKSDTYVGTGLIYDVTLSVVDSSGRVLGEKTLNGRDDLGGNFWDPPGHAREAVPRAFKGKLEDLLNDAAVTAALTSGSPAR
jgi:hypothetical protein